MAKHREQKKPRTENLIRARLQKSAGLLQADPHLIMIGPVLGFVLVVL